MSNLDNITPKKKKKQRSLTLRERRFIKALPTSKSISEAMRKAGYSESVINSGVRDKMLQKLTLRKLWKSKESLTREL